MKKRIGLVSLGCPKNLVDSEVMLGLLRKAGHEITTDPARADVVIVNTCAFIESAKQESIDAILELARQKQAAGSRLIVAGCLAERYREELTKEIPEIDAIVGTGAVPDIVEAVGGPNGAASPARPAAFFRDRAAATGVASRPEYIYDADTPRVLSTPAHLAYLKVAEGCNYGCSFCIIPKLRGSYRSRSAESVLEEAEHLAGAGVKELILISQDTTFYGHDRGERGSLAALLLKLNSIEGLRRIRLLYLYPTTIDDATLDAMASCEKVCRYVDVPLQHASDRVLRRMRRPGSRVSYEKLLDRIRTRVPGVVLRTTFIVGFPGETEAEFQELLSFVEQSAFDHVGVFRYSHEEGTAAFDLPDDVPPSVKKRRERRLMLAQRQIVRAANRRLVGSRIEVMVDGRSADHELVLQGRSAGQAPEIDPVIYLDGFDLAAVRPGDIVGAVVTGFRDYDLVARPMTSP